MPISDRARKLLWARSGNRCAYCKGDLTLRAADSDRDAIVGDECHIAARNVGGPRFDPAAADTDNDDYNNLILLCRTHHKMIDDQPSTYTASKLKAMKAAHERWVCDTLVGAADSADTPVIIQIRFSMSTGPSCLDPEFVSYIRALYGPGRRPKVILDLDRDFLSNALVLPTAVYDMAPGTLGIHAIANTIRTTGAESPKERTFFVSYAEAEPRLIELENDLRVGVLMFFEDREITAWIPSAEDVVAAVHGYARKFLWNVSSPWKIELRLQGAPPDWKAVAVLSESNAVAFLKRTSPRSSGGWLDFSHEDLVGAVIPALVFEATRPRGWGDPVPLSMLDVRQLTWFSTHECDDAWRRLTSACTRRPRD